MDINKFPPGWSGEIIRNPVMDMAPAIGRLEEPDGYFYFPDVFKRAGETFMQALKRMAWARHLGNH